MKKKTIDITHPHLLKEWDYDKNTIKPYEITYGSIKLISWKCGKGHEWEISPNQRSYYKSGCPYCSGQKVCKDNCLLTVDPNLAKEWDYDKNKTKPEEVTSGSTKKVWWKCKKGHEWAANVYDRSKGIGCPYCSNKKVCKDNCLSTTHPELIKEWSNKNKLQPTEVTYGSARKAWWICKKGHEWKSSLNNRATGFGCPYCSGRKVCKDNCLSTTHPELAKEWSNKNKIKPEEVTYGSKKKIWWKCYRGHEWKLSPNIRTSCGQNCPYCSNQRVCKDNCLATTHPNLLKEWSNKNALKPTGIIAGSNKKVWWKCSAGHEWEASPNKRKSGRGCPICNESKGEKLVTKVLEELKAKYEREYVFKKLNKYRFDFALFKSYKNIPYAIIEYHGEQHYRPIKFSSNISLAKAKENLVSCQKRDKIKKQYCLDNNIKYLEINYKEKDNIKEIVRRFIYECA